MAPSPENDNEPKAPDKNDSKKSGTGGNKLSAELIDLESLLDTSTDQESSVSTLDDGQLKALLDEAINYKCPKDREGKSKIFNVLLKEAEEDERNARAASASGPQLARYYNTSARRHRGRKNHQQSIAESITHGGSLQNLAQPELFESGTYSALGGTGERCRSRRGGSGKKGTVSSRQREGGSLPSNVNSTGGRGFVSSFESHRTKMSVEMVPLNRSDQNRNTNTDINSDKNTNTRCSSGDYIIDVPDPEETKSLLDNDVLSHNYESVSSPYHHDCSTQQQDSEPMPVVNKLRYPSSRTNIDTAISFSQLTSNSLEGGNIIPLQLETNYNSVKSIVENSGNSELKSEPLTTTTNVRSTSLRMLPSNALTKQLDSLSIKKSYDENGNAVSLENNGKTKKKKPKTDRKVTIYNPESVAGHRADIIEDIDQLVKYVESNDAEGSNSSKRSSKHQQRRSTSGRTLNNKTNKQSENSVKKSNSMEEISTSKLEDLVGSKGDRRSWGTEDGEQYYCKKIQHNQPEEVVINTETSIEMADFQVVNKKKKSRKRRSETLSGTNSAPSGGLSSGDPSISNTNQARNRRKSSCSMPVSDKSDSSDLDSVHSLPVSAKLSNVNSYAERVQVLNNNSQTKDKPVFLNSVEHFPELCRVNNNNINLDNNLNVNSVSVIESKLRPAVIIPVSNKEAFYEVSGLTFGFEVNEQLLALDNDDCDVKNTGVCLADSFTARFVAPVIEFNYNHDKIVSYVGQEWEKIVHQSGNKVKYYSGQ